MNTLAHYPSSPPLHDLNVAMDFVLLACRPGVCSDTEKVENLMELVFD